MNRKIPECFAALLVHSIKQSYSSCSCQGPHATCHFRPVRRACARRFQCIIATEQTTSQPVAVIEVSLQSSQVSLCMLCLSYSCFCCCTVYTCLYLTPIELCPGAALQTGMYAPRMQLLMQVAITGARAAGSLASFGSRLRRNVCVCGMHGGSGGLSAARSSIEAFESS